MNQEQVKAVKLALEIAEEHAKTGKNHNAEQTCCNLCEAVIICGQCPLYNFCIAPTREPSMANRLFYAKVVEILQRALR